MFPGLKLIGQSILHRNRVYSEDVTPTFVVRLRCKTIKTHCTTVNYIQVNCAHSTNQTLGIFFQDTWLKYTRLFL